MLYRQFIPWHDTISHWTMATLATTLPALLARCQLGKPVMKLTALKNADWDEGDSCNPDDQDCSDCPDSYWTGESGQKKTRMNR